MSSTVIAPYAHLGEGGDYPIEVNFAVRVYDNKGESIPPVGELGYSLKGGLRTNRIGIVPLLDGRKEEVGKAEVLILVAAKPENMDLPLVQKCGFTTIEEATEYARQEHGDEFSRDGVLTIFVYKVVELYR
ncbi:MAG: hypothetical protein UU77_C0001G0022 [candidate division WWE3 bacterium GW2011_GWC1_41_7]|uniref:Uncharacterized protein n=4 Tax=Katanobacteria TaxID=422282 RepID=A0A0G0XAW8_UNCKA|nr:MAG: hypothetical protein UU72_C0003G0023 [candidate division WWE3 bacterium GW2011_GWB1_41_6]KKS21527.1 MAG: hypothetical protein UU77_C0001G0022 [candidate division WWE3 bacterium GW2011_GWC1_41_7]KKS22514.1 MAG: hypothetical protein UU80_C0006G0040 [candidate division WWE3 bacterium GW2011_GWA1_41_8]OGC56915.1 MAG: hypothetical protein A2976_00675 [candidate division WWE3 bacterium RIFCSPLOWO2_01_FULL_41_9]